MSDSQSESFFFPGKVILFGEHSVLYGSNALAVPIDSGIHFNRKPHDSFEININGELLLSKPELTRIFNILYTYRVKPSMITIDSTLPPGGGLGFSAAISAGFATLCLGKKADLIDLNNLAFEFEKIFHGNPSGIDNTTVVYKSTVLTTVRPESFITEKLTQINEIFYLTDPVIPQNLTIAVCFSGIYSKTRDMIEVVRLKSPVLISKFVKNINRLLEDFLKYSRMNNPHELGKCLTNAHHELGKIGLSTPYLDQLVELAVTAGAYGAKLTGKGGGGSVIALINKENLPKLISNWKSAGAQPVSNGFHL